MEKIFVADTTLRDGSHTVLHQFSIDDLKRVAKGLDEAGVSVIEVGHGDGLKGSSINYGPSLNSDIEMIKAVSSVVKDAKIAVLLIPGIGTVESLEEAKKAGVTAVRVATHVTEADISAQHIRAAKEMGLFTIGFLMMAHMADVDKVVEEAKKMESYGADVVYCTDSAGAMLPEDVREKIGELKKNLNVPIGFHSHNNLGLAIGNCVAAIEAGATYIDGSLSGFGAGAGNTSTETLIGVLNKMDCNHDCDLYKAMDVSAKELKPVAESHGVDLHINHDSMMLGYAGVYSSFMLHAKKASERFGVDYRDIIVELGKKKAVGGQEDWIVEIASKIADQKINK